VNRGHRPTRNNAPPVHSNSETKRSRRQSSTQCPFWAAAERALAAAGDARDRGAGSLDRSAATQILPAPEGPTAPLKPR
jgi:hypothetical protein